jgi:hypothetical protein
MKKAFKISIVIFGISFWLLINAALANVGGYDYILDSTAVVAAPIKPIIRAIQATEGLDFIVCLLSGLSSLVTGFLK